MIKSFAVTGIRTHDLLSVVFRAALPSLQGFASIRSITLPLLVANRASQLAEFYFVIVCDRKNRTISNADKKNLQRTSQSRYPPFPGLTFIGHQTPLRFSFLLGDN